MSQTIEAIYENGRFKPIEPEKVHIAEGQRVKLVVDESTLPEAILLATKVYEGLSGQDISEIEEVAFDRSHFFEKSAPND
jgi:predicted DNA-binding antitoxin AbrB/MazE fold protein